MIRKSIIFMVLSCFAVCVCGSELTDSALVMQWQNTGKKISSVLNLLDNEFAVKQAMPQLKKLAAKYGRLIAEFGSRQKADLMFGSRYAAEALFTIREFKKALAKFNANDEISFEWRQKVMKLLGKLNAKIKQ